MTNGETLIDYNFRVGLSPKRTYKLDKLIGRDVKNVPQWDMESEKEEELASN